MEEQEKEKRTLWFRAVLVPEKGGGYSAYCPGLPGVISGGSTKQEALNNLSEAVSLHLRALSEQGTPVAQGDALPEPGPLARVLRGLLLRGHQEVPIQAHS